MHNATNLKSSTAKTAKSEKFSDGVIAFADFVLTLSVYPNPRGDLIALFKTLVNAGACPPVTCWRDLYLLLSRRDASGETILEARKLWRQYQKSTAPLRAATAVSPAQPRRADHG